MSESALAEEAVVTASLSGRKWRVRPVDDRLAQAVAREWDVPHLLARLMLARGIAADNVGDYLNPSLKAQLPDPSHLKDMDEAAERLAQAVAAGERIAIFGDYDVDGATSTALLSRYFAALGAPPLVHIPDRITEGYGPNAPALLALKTRGASVIVTVDCGTMAFAPLEAAHQAGLDVIVIDHHIGEARRPACFALVNPNRLDETSPHRQLAAVGVAFLLAVAVQRTLKAAGWFNSRPAPNLLQLLDLAALGTVCDVVSLTGVNRALVAQGLKIMGGRANLGLRALMDVARAEAAPCAYTCGFILGPRVNAGGRVGKADFGARLLSTAEEEEALSLARALDGYNTERKAIEAMVLEAAMAQAEAQMLAELPVILVAGQGWHPGVIGIVAGRIKERFGLPVAVIALSDDIGKASARSVPGFDFGASVIAAVEAGLLVQGGGHAMAAGFTVEEAKIPALQAFFARRLAMQGGVAESVLSLDGALALSGATVELAVSLERAAPFGQGNAAPRVMLQYVTLADVQELAGGHLRLILVDGKTRTAAMAFRAGGTPLGAALKRHIGRKIHAACSMRLSQWQGREQVKLTVEDVAVTN